MCVSQIHKLQEEEEKTMADQMPGIFRHYEVFEYTTSVQKRSVNYLLLPAEVKNEVKLAGSLIIFTWHPPLP